VKSKIAVMSFRGGQKNSFSFCLLEYFQENKRWVVSSLFDSKSSKQQSVDEIVADWIKEKDVEILTVDFPRTFPPCHSCEISCPGFKSCTVLDVNEITFKIRELLIVDSSEERENPKKYEQDRNRDTMFDYSKDILSKDAADYMLSRSFKRRLKKGFVPYWNRGVDFYIWYYYYDQLLELFNSSFNSFGNASYMILSRFSFIEKNIPAKTKIAEAVNKILLIELLRKKIITKKSILDLSSLEHVREARVSIIEKIEAHFNIFMYEYDLERIANNHRYFDAFLMSLNGLLLAENRNRTLPSWAGVDSFIIPA
jgi:hypothetical protein